MKFNSLVVFIFFIVFSSSAQNQIIPWTYDPSYNVGFATDQYEAWLYKRTVSSVQQRLPFRMLKPKAYDPLRVMKYPMVIMLHGRGESGSNNQYQLLHGGKPHLDAVNMVNGVTFPGFVLFPQEPYGQWTNNPTFGATQLTTALEMVFDLIDSLKLKYNIDPNRIYVHGLSSGGTGTWACLYHRPDLFAAALPMSTPGDTSQAKKICPIPFWLSQGGVDTNPIPYVSHLMMAAIRAAGAIDSTITKYTEYPGQGHGIWDLTYANPDFFPYMLRQSKSNVMVLGNNPFCPGQTVDIAISANYYAYRWFYTSLANTITGANTFRLSNISTAGSYFAGFKRTAASAWEYSGSVNIIAGVASPKPTVTVNNTLLLPGPGGNSVTLKGPANFKGYIWTNGAKTQSITISNSGTYSLKVDPAIGCRSLKSDDIVVRAGPNGPNPPAMASNLGAFPISSSSIILRWQDNATNETGYEIYRSTQKGGPYAYISALSIDSQNFTDAGLKPNTIYYYRVRSVNTDGGVLSLEEARATTAKDFVIPTAPTGLQISKFTPTIIQLSWTPAFDSSGIKQYIVYNRDTLLGVSDTTIFKIPSLIRGSSNSFRLIAVDNGGNVSSPSNDVPFFYNGIGLFSTYYSGIWSVLPNFATTKELVNGLVSNFTVNTSIPMIINTLSGVDMVPSGITTNLAIKSDGYIFINASSITGTTYRFYTTSDDGSKLWMKNSTTATVNNDGLHGMVEQYGDVTFNAKGWYPISAAFFQQGGGYGLQTRYECLSGCVSTVTSVNAKQAIPNSVLSYFNTGTTTGVNSPPGQNVLLTVVNFYPYAVGLNDKARVKLQWSWSPNTFTGLVRGFEIYRIKGGALPGFTSNWSKIATVANQPVSFNTYNYIDTTDFPGVVLTNNTKYYYAIKGLTASGNTGYIGYTGPINKPTFAGVNTASSVTGIPLAPSNLSLLGVSNSVISLFWIRNSNNESGFEVWRSYTKNGIYAQVVLVPRGYNTYSDSTCEGNTKYVYKIRAYNSAGFSAFSNIDSTISPNIPTAPSNLQTLTTGPNSINLTWIANTDIADGYSIYRSQTSWKAGFTRIDSIPNPHLSIYQDKTVMPNTKYYYKVRAYNSIPSVFSNVDSASTLADITPSASDWKLNAESAYTLFNASFSNALNQDKLITAITSKKDFFNYLAITPTGFGSITVKLPPLDSMPRGGIFTFNLAQGTGTSAVPKGDTLSGGVLSFFNDYFGTGIFTVDVSISNDNTNWTVSGLNPVLRRRSNDLQKIDFPASFSGKWMKITITSKYNYNPNLFITEVGMYRILPPGTRHNYFIVLGASIEEQNPPMGLAKFRERLLANGYAQGNTALVFNWAISGTSSMQLADSIAPFLDMHPYASYVLVHQGGNNINNSGNGLRPLTFEMLGNNTSVQLFTKSFKTFFTATLSRKMIPFISRMHFRDYKDGLVTGQVPNLPAVKQGRNQENGSLPYNLIIDSLTRIYAPFIYNDAERRSNVNFYPISLNDQTIVGGDGIHPVNSAMQINKLTDFWVNYVFKYVYTGSFFTPIVYSPGPVNLCTNTVDPYQDPPCWQKYFNCPAGVDCYSNSTFLNYEPANKPHLIDSVSNAVELSKRTLLGKDIWNAQILVEQLGSTAIRIPYVLSLDTLRDYRMPANPSSLSVFVISNTALSLNWIRNSLNNTGFEIYRSSTGGNSYKKVGVVTVPSSFSFVDAGLSNDSLYYYYVRAVNGNFKSGWSNIVNARPASTYYSKASGDVTDVNTWGREQDGSGLNPPDFTTGGQVFTLTNRGGTSYVNTNWTVSGNNSKVIVSSATRLTIVDGVICTATIDVLDQARLDILGLNNPTLGIIDPTSTISFGNPQLIQPRNYGDLIFAGAGTRNMNTGTFTINNQLQIDPNITLQGNYSILVLNKGFAFGDASTTLNNLSILINGDSCTLDAKSGTMNLNGLTISGYSIASIINGSSINVGSTATGFLLIKDNGKLYVNNGNLTISGSAILNPGSTTGQLLVSGGSIYFNTTGTQPHSLYFNDQFNYVNNFYMNLGNSTCNVNLFSAMNLTNTIKLKRGVFNSNKYLTLLSTNINSARLAKVEVGASLSGGITKQRSIGPFKTKSNYFLASCITNQPISTWSNFIILSGFTTLGMNNTISGKSSSILNYNEATNAWKAIRDSTTLIKPGTGYKVVLNTADLSYSDSSGFYANTGTPVIGDATGNPAAAFSIPVSKSKASAGWNLVANPYPCEIDWDAPIGWNKAGLNNAYYVYDGASSKYRVYIGAGGVNENAVGSEGMTSIINSNQGFWIYVSSLGNRTVTLTEDVKTEVTNLPTFYRNEDPDYNVIRIYLKYEQKDSDEAIIRFIDNSTPLFDLQIDALKLENENFNISTITPADESLVVNSVPLTSNLTIPIKVQSYTEGAHSLTFKGIDNIADTLQVILKDHYLNKVTDLKQTLSYEFEITKDSLSYGDKRFELIFNEQNVTDIKKEIHGKSLIVYQNVPNPVSQTTTIRFDLPYDNSVNIIIYNSFGQIVKQHEERYKTGLNEYTFEVTDGLFSGSHEGIYFYKVTGCGKSVTKKMAVFR